MNLNFSNLNGAGDWALRISQKLNATISINPVKGKERFGNNKFEASNIELRFLQPGSKTYNQRREHFTPALSIIDVIMFNEPAAIKDLINDYQIIKPDDFR